MPNKTTGNDIAQILHSIDDNQPAASVAEGTTVVTPQGIVVFWKEADGKVYAVQATHPLPVAGALTVSGAVTITGTIDIGASGGAPITGQVLEAGGSGIMGWLASLRKKLPAFGTSAAPSADLISVALQPAISGGWTPYRNIDVQNAGSIVKSGPGNLGGWYVYNAASTTRFLKIYDMTTAPAAGDGANLKLTIPIPAGGAANLSLPSGISFPTGIGIRASSLVADADASVPTANDVQVDLWYK